MIPLQDKVKVQKLFNEAFIFEKRTDWKLIDWYNLLFKKRSQTLENVLSPQLDLNLPDEFKAAIRYILKNRGIDLD